MSVELEAVLAAVIVTVAIVGLAIGARKYGGLIETNTYVVAVVAGLIVYAIVSGRVTEFSGGGFSAKLTALVHSEINAPSVSLNSVSVNMAPTETVTKGSMEQLRAVLPKLTEGRPIVLSLRMGTTQAYGPNVLDFVKQYLAELGQYRSFHFVLFTDEKDAVKAYIPATSLIRMLNVDARTSSTDPQRIIEIINRGALDQLTSLPGVTTITIRSDATNLTALEKMEQENLDGIVVVDPGNDHAVGVIDRGQLLTKLVVAIAKNRASP